MLRKSGRQQLEAITSPVISTTCTRVPGMRFPDPRVQALLGACCALALRPAGFTSRDLRHYLAPQLGKTPEDMTGGQISYDLPAPRGALSYPRFSREELGRRFLGLMAYSRSER